MRKETLEAVGSPHNGDRILHAKDGLTNQGDSPAPSAWTRANV